MFESFYNNLSANNINLFTETNSNIKDYYFNNGWESILNIDNTQDINDILNTVEISCEMYSIITGNETRNNAKYFIVTTKNKLYPYEFKTIVNGSYVLNMKIIETNCLHRVNYIYDIKHSIIKPAVINKETLSEYYILGKKLSKLDWLNNPFVIKYKIGTFLNDN